MQKVYIYIPFGKYWRFRKSAVATTLVIIFFDFLIDNAASNTVVGYIAVKNPLPNLHVQCARNNKSRENKTELFELRTFLNTSAVT